MSDQYVVVRLIETRDVPKDFWVAEIRISDRMEEKIRTHRFVTGQQVRQACIPAAYETATWDDDPVHGLRLAVTCTTSDGVPLKVLLQPVDASEGIWRLRTVWRRTR